METVTEVLPAYIFRVMKTVCGASLCGVATAAGAEALPKPPGAFE